MSGNHYRDNDILTGSPTSHHPSRGIEQYDKYS